jgi:hypothetical protein
VEGRAHPSYDGRRTDHLSQAEPLSFSITSTLRCADELVGYAGRQVGREVCAPPGSNWPLHSCNPFTSYWYPATSINVKVMALPGMISRRNNFGSYLRYRRRAKMRRGHAPAGIDGLTW